MFYLLGYSPRNTPHHFVFSCVTNELKPPLGAASGSGMEHLSQLTGWQGMEISSEIFTSFHFPTHF